MTSNNNLWSFFLVTRHAIKARLIFLALAAVFVLVLTLYCVGNLFKWSMGLTHEQQVRLYGEPPPEPIPLFRYVYELKDVSIALTDKTFTRTGYAQFSLTLDCPDEEGKRYFEVNRAKILDSLFEVASDFHLDDFSKPQGFPTFKSHLLTKLKSVFGERGPRAVVINDWLLQ